jgi:hypothetical protein
MCVYVCVCASVYMCSVCMHALSLLSLSWPIVTSNRHATESNTKGPLKVTACVCLCVFVRVCVFMNVCECVYVCVCVCVYVPACAAIHVITERQRESETEENSDTYFKSGEGKQLKFG